MKLPFLCGLLCLLATLLTMPARAAPVSVPVQINGTPLNARCYAEDGRTYVPFRTLMNHLGGWTVEWNDYTRTATAESDEIYLAVEPDFDTITVNGRSFSAHLALEAGRIYVPLRILMEALSAAVVWDPYLGGATVTTADFPYDAVDLYWLSRIIYAESGAEPFEGQIAVGNVVLNRVQSSKFPNTIPAVIFDSKDAIQFEPVANGTLYQLPSLQAVRAAKAAMDGENPIGRAMYFYAPALSQGLWINANCTYQQTIGCHRFYI